MGGQAAYLGAGRGRAFLGPTRTDLLALGGAPTFNLDAGNIDGSGDNSGLVIGQNLASWANLGSAAASDPAQATPGLQPTFAANVNDGRPGVLFDGVDDELRTPNALSNFLTAAAGTVFVVATPLTLSPAVYNAAGTRPAIGDTGSFFNITMRTDAIYGMFSGAYINGASGTTPFAVNTRGMVSGWHDSVEISSRANGGALAPTAAGAVGGVASVLAIGAGWTSAAHFHGYIHQVLIYNTVLSPEVYAQTFNFLRGKWALP